VTEERTHAPTTMSASRGYCGRKTRNLTPNWQAVTCTDCHAAHRADKDTP
jgi:hypothetical protein